MSHSASLRAIPEPSHLPSDAELTEMQRRTLITATAKPGLCREINGKRERSTPTNTAERD